MMKRICLAILLVFSFGAVASDKVRSDAVSGILVDLYKKPKKGEWKVQKISSVITASEIKHLVLLRAETSAPGEVDAVNILKALSPEKTFIEPPKTDWLPVYECVVITKNGRIFYVSIGSKFGFVRSAHKNMTLGEMREETLLHSCEAMPGGEVASPQTKATLPYTSELRDTAGRG